MANSDSNLSDFNIDHSGYHRFFNDIDNLDAYDETIITVRREQQITAHFIPQDPKSKITVSLSQEQIVNRLNGSRPEITRSQSINIEKSFELPKNGRRGTLSRQNSLKPSLIPIKMKESSAQPLKQLMDATAEPQSSTTTSMIPRKLNDPTDKRKFTSQQELKVNSPPLTMTHSMDTALEPKHSISDVRHQLPDRFKCSVCMNVLNDPRVLDCLHTFCLECLYSIENTNHSKTVTNKTNVPAKNEPQDTDGCCSNSMNSLDAKESGRKSPKASILISSTNPIRKIFFSMPRKRTDERTKVGQI